MSGQMCWLPKFGDGDEKILHIRLESYHPWKLYTLYSGLCVPEYNIPGGSKGWATCQKLLQAGWTLIPNDKAQSSSFDQKRVA